MENLTDALKMSFGIFVLIIALSIFTYSMSRSRKTADAILKYSDKTEFYQYEGAVEEYANGRRVNVNEMISTLYRCAREHFAVRIIDNDYNKLFDLEYMSSSELYSEIRNFVNSKIGSEEEYREYIVEIATSGKYLVADDGTQLTETSGAKKIIYNI